MDTLSNVKRKDVKRYIKLSKEKKQLKSELEPKIERLAQICANTYKDVYRYVENWYIENSTIHIETIGYHFGEINNYYCLPLGFIYEDEDKISRLIWERDQQKRKLRMQKEQDELEAKERKEYNRLKEKFENE